MKLPSKRYRKVGVLALLALLLIAIVLRLSVAGDMPSSKEIAQIKNPLASELYAKDGRLIGRFYIENRSHLEFEDLNESFRNALLATEDIRFFEHNGIDKRSLTRVAIKTLLLQDDASGGGSTLTQQLAKNLFPRKPYTILSTIRNKLREMIIAKRMERLYEKEDLMLLYSNTVSFGERAFGLGTAANRFFNKEPHDLSLEEAATLVGVLKATSYYSPRKHPERALGRRNLVLQQMAKYGFISKEVLEKAISLPLALDYQPPGESEEFAPYFKQFVRREFEKWNKESGSGTSHYDLYKDGLKIYTTLDLDFQIAATEAMRDHMARLQQQFIQSWKDGRMFGKGTRIIDDKILAHPEYKALRKAGKTAEEALTYFTTRGNRDLWTWEGIETREITKIDSLKHYLSLLHTGILAVEPRTGTIRAWVGGINYDQFQFDNIIARRQVGSTFKPIVYLAGLENGMNPCTVYPNELMSYPAYENWTPKNANNEYGGEVSMQTALTHSINTVSVQVLFDVGVPEVVRMSRQLGIGSPLNEVPSIVLGTSDISLFEMVQAYSILANEGYKSPISAIRRIEDAKGRVLFEYSNEKQQPSRVASREAVKLLNGMLHNATQDGTGRRLYAQFDIDFPVMGKTGTTQNQSDGWFIAYNKDLAIGAWVGTEDRRMHFRNLATGSGGRTALPMVGALFEYADKEDQITDRDFLAYTSSFCFDDYGYDPVLKRSLRYNESRFNRRLDRVRNSRYYRTEEERYRRMQEIYQQERIRRQERYERARKKWERRLERLKKRRERSRY